MAPTGRAASRQILAFCAILLFPRELAPTYTSDMIKRLVFLLNLFGAGALLFGQLDSNSVTVTATRNLNTQPDQALLEITVTSPLDATLDNVVALLQGVGITAANFNAAGLFQPNFPPDQQATQMLEWGFGTGVPVAKLKDTLSQLTSLQQTIAKKNNGFTLSFAVQGLQVSPQLQQSQVCKPADLIADARAQAQKLADASGLMVGAILGLSAATSTNVGSILPAGYFPGQINFGVSTFPAPCSATVKFALSRF